MEATDRLNQNYMLNCHLGFLKTLNDARAASVRFLKDNI